MTTNISILEQRELQLEEVERDIINHINKPLDNYNDAEMLNVIWKRGIRGDTSTVVANSYLSAKIASRPTHNFGSIEDFDIDTYPTSMIRCKDTEITQIQRRSKTFSGKAFISRIFLSNVLMWWSYAIGIRYTQAVEGDNSLNAINLWKHKIEVDYKIVGKTEIIDGQKKVIPYTEWLKKTSSVDCIRGDNAILMIKDLIFLIRNKSPEDMGDSLSTENLSPIFYETIRTLASKRKQTYRELFEDIKSRLYYTEQQGEIAWSFPKLDVNYLHGIIEELQSGYYHTDISIPLVHKPYQYPLKCTGITSNTPRTDEEHSKNFDDYNHDQHLFERD